MLLAIFYCDGIFGCYNWFASWTVLVYDLDVQLLIRCAHG
jgi:hypothetical protein